MDKINEILNYFLETYNSHFDEKLPNFKYIDTNYKNELRFISNSEEGEYLELFLPATLFISANWKEIIVELADGLYNRELIRKLES